MKRNEDDRMWQRIERAHTPTPDDLDRTERELSDLRAMPLHEDRARRMIERAGVSDASPAGAVRRRGKLAAAGIALFAVSAAAFVLNPGIVRQRSPVPVLTIEFQQAVEHLTTAGATRNEWRDAIVFIDSHCSEALQALIHLADDEDQEVAQMAREALSRLADGACRGATGETSSVKDARHVALDANQLRAARLSAIERLEELTSLGVAAMRRAHADTPRARQLRSAYVTRFEADLEAAR